MKLPQFSLRELLLLVLVIGLALGWWVHGRQLQRSLINQRRLVESFATVLRSLECKIEPDAGGLTKVTIPYNISTGMLGMPVPVPFKEFQETLDDRSIWIGAYDGINDSRQP
jgi:hypothetical protein